MRIGNKPLDLDIDGLEGPGQRLRKIRGEIEGSLTGLKVRLCSVCQRGSHPAAKKMPSSRQLSLGPAAMNWGEF